MKPGFKTTEFWLTLSLIITTAVTQSDLFTKESPIYGLLVAIAAGLAAAGYSISRGLTKRT